MTGLLIKLEGTRRVRTHAVLLYPNSNPNLWPWNTKTMSLLGYPKVIPYITLGSFVFELCSRQINRQTQTQTTPTDRVAMYVIKCARHHKTLSLAEIKRLNALARLQCYIYRTVIWNVPVRSLRGTFETISQRASRPTMEILNMLLNTGFKMKLLIATFVIVGPIWFWRHIECVFCPISVLLTFEWMNDVFY